ncbi:MAG: hypothetical protein ACK4M1_00010 [Flavobacterium sp.]
MKTKFTFLVLISFISLSSFKIFERFETNKSISEVYEATLVIKKERESSTITSMFYNEYVPVKVQIDGKNKIIKVSNLTTIKIDHILFSFVGEKVNFNNKNIALSNELAIYDEKTQKIQYFYLKMDKKKLVKS